MSVIIFLSCNDPDCDTILPVDGQDVITARIQARNKGWDTTRHFDPATKKIITEDQCEVHKVPRDDNVPANLLERVPSQECVSEHCPARRLWAQELGAEEVYDWCGHDALGHRMANLLARDGHNTVAKVLALTEGDLWDIRNFGRMCVERWKAFRAEDIDA